MYLIVLSVLIGYIFLQVYSLWTLRGLPRILSALLLLLILLVSIFTIYLFQVQSNLWPMFLLLAVPVVDLSLLALLIVNYARRAYSKRSER
jgi:hypothetical protein